MTMNADHAQVRVAPPVVFLAYLIGALLLTRAFPLPAPWTAIFRIVGGLMIVAGLLLGGSAVSRMMKANTSLDPHQPTMALVTDGPYGRTRNPIYLGFFLIYLGFTCLAGTLWGILLTPFLVVTVNLAIIRAEEAYLEGRFGGRYAAYKERVRQWL